MNSGEVPNLYPIEERQEIIEIVRLAAQGGNRNLDISPLAVFSFFINRVKEKLHIVLSFSPIGSAFRTRLRLYPSIVNCCTIDWYEDWPENALEMVAEYWMQSMNVTQEIKDASVDICKDFHIESRQICALFYEKYGRKTYITSASYLDLIKSYQSLMKRKQEELTLAKFRYLNGLDKLAFAAEQVAVMQLKLEELQPQLEAANTRAKAMLKQIEKETREAEYASMLVREDEKVANVQAAAAQELKADCEADLAQVIPILEEAIDALNTLKPADITLVKSMKNPPSVVKLVMAAICVMKDIKPDRVPEPGTGRMVLDYWGPSKRVLGEMTFLQQLKDFDKDHIPIAVITKIRKEYITNKDFRPEIVAKASSAAEGLCKWIIAMDLYDKVARIVAPKKEKLEMAESEYAATMAILQEKRDQVTRLEERLRDLNAQLEEAQAEQEALQNSVDLCREKLIRAKKLIDGLGGEKTRWTMVAGDLQVQFDSLAGDILISCGVIAYLAPLTIQYRNECIANWRQKCIEKDIPCSKEYDFITVLGSDITIQQWYIDGLPRDAFSTQNAIIQNSSCRWSLLVDPQNQANKWIKLMEKKNNLSVVKFNDPTYMKVIENSIEFGMPVLIENIQETLDAPIDPILSNKIFKQGGILVIALGDNVIPYHRSFRLYLTTKLRNPHYMPEVFNKVTIINFALTMQGLEDQLLGIVVANERPDLQKKKEQLVQESAENRTALKNVEDTILKTLAEAEGDILENETAIQVLDNAKDLAFNILQKQTVTKQTEESIEKFRLAYRPVAVHSTILYYSISDLPNVDPMYQYSLVWFINLYRMSILNSSKSNVLTQRLENIKTLFTYNLYSNVCRSLFEKDKTLYAFVLTMKVMESKGLLDKQEYSFFLTGGINVENPIRNPSTWLSKKSWDELCRLDELPAFRGIRDNFSKNTDLWQELYDSNAPQTHKLPGKWQDALSVFQRLLIIRIIRLDKLNLAVHQFVNNMMGSEYVTPPPFDLTKSYADSNHLSPLIFILSPGSDPMMPLTKFAERKGYASKFQSISLGQGQGPIAEAMIRSGMGTGSWVCLQNCHLAVSWMSNLEKICETMDDSNTSDTFRLWLTSYPSDKFPVSILQNGVKMTNEPPGGLHQNLRLSYLSDPIKDSEFYYSLGEKEFDFSRLIYGICFFHAVVQERRTFGPLGWNIPYGFNDSDLHISLQQLQMFMREQKEIPYEALTYLIGECNYGGRVTDDWDRRLIVTILDDFLNPSVVKDRNYVFAGNDKRYGLPMKTSYENYLEHISKLPEQHSPEVFGLHENAGITRDLQNALLMLTSLLLVEGEGSSAGGDTDQLLANLINELLVKIPDLYNIELAQKKFPVEYSESMNTVLVQEMERFNKLLRVMRTTLITLQNAILGIVAITPQLEMLANSLLLSRLPDAWASVSYPTLKPLGGYINDLIRRLEFLQTWHDEGKPPTFWLSGFFFTQAFLTGAKQNYARKSVTPIDQLDFDHIVLKEFYMNSVPSTGVHVNGLFVDGAHWDVQKGHLIEQKPKILWDELPVIWLKPILIEKFVEGNRYKSPVYKTSERRGILSTTGHSTNYVLPIFLTTTVGKAHWIKRSTALLCQLDE